MKTRFIYQDDKSHKFWHIDTNGTDLTVQYGKVGTTGQSQTKQFASAEECLKAADKLIAEKEKKGYIRQHDDVTTTTPAPVDDAFAPPTELYADLLALATYLEEYYPEEQPEVKKVSEDDITAMEDSAGFELPSSYVDYWLEKGSFLFSKDDFTCEIYAYTGDEQQGDNLYNTLVILQNTYHFTFRLTEQEKDYFSQCCWVLGMAGTDNELRLYVADPLENVHILHFPKGFAKTNNEGFEEAMAPILREKRKFSMMISKTATTSGTTVALAEPAYQETPAAKMGDGFEELSYDEVLERLGVDQLFDYWDDEDNDYADDYESEREYFEDGTITFHDGDLHAGEDHDIGGLIVVRGNMTITGKVSFQYYVTGNTTVDYIDLSDFQRTLGEETIRYVASAYAEDDEALRKLAYRKINAPYFFSWFYDLAYFDFAPETVITALYNYDDLTAYETDNTFLMWHEYAYAFKPELYYTVEASHHDGLTVAIDSFYEAVKGGLNPFLDGVTPEGINLVKKGEALEQENDLLGAYQTYRKAISTSPGYYPAYKAAGKLLYDQKAYAQAMELYAKAIPLTPEKVQYEISCIENGGIAAIRLGKYDQAIEWAQIGIARNNEVGFSLRILAEALICMGELEEAKPYLERSIKIKNFFSNNWLLGLIYFLQGDTQKADTYYQVAVEKNGKARPYTEHKDLTYIYGEPVTVDWDTRKPVSTEKGQEYWDRFLTESLPEYGLDLYSRVGQWPSQWIFAKVSKIPAKYRTSEMLHLLLDHTTQEQPDITGRVIAYFDPALLTEEIIFQAVNRMEPAQYEEIPAAYISEKLLRIHPKGINLSVLPADQLNYALCFDAVSQNQHNYKYVPKAFQDERMNIALIAGGNLGDYPVKRLPSKYYTNEYIKQAIDIHIMAITRLPMALVDKEVYEHAVSRYGNDPMWPFIVERYDGNTWRYGSLSTVEILGENVRKFGIDVFDHVEAKYISRQSYSYYKKHLGHLPAFEEKVKTYGWEKNRQKSSEYDEEKQFTYDTFRKVWSCFWTEDFIIKALDKKEDRERLLSLPDKFKTQRICDIAVKMNAYDFAFVPRQFITQEMCMDACSSKYGSALEYVPLEMRTTEICKASVARSADNIKFVPVPLRSTELCINAILQDSRLTTYIPHALYTAVFESCFQNRKKSFSEDFLLVNWGLGLIMDKQYSAAREKLSAVSTDSSKHYHHATYYIGWSYFLEGDLKTAKEHFTKSQDVAKQGDLYNAEMLTIPYASFQLLPVPEVYPFYKEQFNTQMEEASVLVQNGDYSEAMALLKNLEKQLTDAQCSEMNWWAYVWDHQRYALYEAGEQGASLDLCRRIIAELGKVTLWDYLEDHNIIRAALRAAHNNLAYSYYQTATDLAGVKEGLHHIKATMKTIAPIENKSVLNIFYETQALLLYRAMGFDPAYRKDLEKVVAKIEKLRSKDQIELSDEYEKIKL